MVAGGLSKLFDSYEKCRSLIERTLCGPVNAPNRFANLESQPHISIHALIGHDLSWLNLACPLATDDHYLVSHACIWDDRQVESRVFDMR
jgi:surfactin synthase thioesterase subunit